MIAATSSYLPQFQSTVTFSHGEKYQGSYTFKTEEPGDCQTLSIEKKETSERTYELSICFFGRKGDKTGWGIKINGLIPSLSEDRPFMYYNSRSFKTTPTSHFNLEIEETDDKNTEKLWVDLSDTKYVISNAPTSIDEKIYRLIVKGLERFSQNNDLVEAIFHNNDLVILYTLRNNYKFFSVARKEDEDFADTSRAYVKDLKKGTNWTIELSQDKSSHTFFYGYDDDQDLSTSRASWDGDKLKTLIPQQLVNSSSAQVTLPCSMPPLGNIQFVFIR